MYHLKLFFNNEFYKFIKILGQNIQNKITYYFSVIVAVSNLRICLSDINFCPFWQNFKKNGLLLQSPRHCQKRYSRNH